jgi:hypothetical protein
MPGRSGNPGGRKNALERRVREKCGEDGERLIDMLVAIADDETARNADRIDAASILFDRGWGKPQQGVDVNVNQPRNPFEDLDPEQLSAFIAFGETVLAARAAGVELDAVIAELAGRTGNGDSEGAVVLELSERASSASRPDG